MSLDLPGFAAPVGDAQACFRAVLDAMARPGSVQAAGAGLRAPLPLAPATAAVLLTLVDQDVRVWLSPAFAPVAEWVAFHCGCRAVDDVADADFVVTDRMPDPAALAQGSDEAPEDGATLILQVPALDSGRRLVLSGPGLRETSALFADGLPADFAAVWQRNRALFPRGIDMILCAGERLAALPRSVRVTED